MAVMASVRRTQTHDHQQWDQPERCSGGDSGRGTGPRRRRGGGARQPCPADRRRGDWPAGHAVAEDRAAMGARDRAALRPLRRVAGAGVVLDRAVHRSRLVGDRSADDRLRFRRRADTDCRHGAGQCRRRAVLDGARRREGGAGGAGLRARGRVGRANGAARHHRPHHAGGAAARAASRCRSNCRS